MSTKDEFEKWATTRERAGPSIAKSADGEYVDALVVAWWQAFLAGRESMREEAVHLFETTTWTAPIAPADIIRAIPLEEK
jgi:hypothetical protein